MKKCLVLAVVMGICAGDVWGLKGKERSSDLRQGLFVRERNRERNFGTDSLARQYEERTKKAKRRAGPGRNAFIQAQTGTKITEHQLNLAFDGLASNGILFLSDRDGQFDLYKMNQDGTSKTRLTNDSCLEYEAKVSSSGNKIAYITWDSSNQSYVYVMNADGTGKTEIASSSNDMWLVDDCWSPNSEWLIYESDESSWVAKVDGSIKNELEENVWDWTWSPDSDWIAYSCMDTNELNDYPCGIYKVAPTGGTPIALVTSTQGSFSNPTYSPDGTWIAYSYGGYPGGIYKVASAGGTPIALATSTQGSFSNPTYSPDGAWIAYSYYENNAHSLCTINVQDSTQIEIATSDWLDFLWSANSQWILYETEEAGLWSAKPDGTAKNRLTLTSPEWFFFLSGSSKVAYTNWKDIYVISTTGGNPINLTDNPCSVGINMEPKWSPDGSKMAYTSLPNKDASGILWGIGIWVMDKNGGNKKEIGTLTTDWWEEFVWSSDGDWIGYKNENGIYKLSSNGGTPIPVVTVTTGWISDLIWPKNDWIAYSYDDWQNNRGIYKVSSDGGTLTALASSTQGSFQGLTSSTDGDWIAYSYSSRVSNERYVYKLPFIGGSPTALASSTQGLFDSPVWSPDGNWIAYIYEGNEEATSTIMLIGANGGQPQVVYTTDKWISQLCWSPDSTKLGFTDGLNSYYISIAGSGLTRTNAQDTFSQLDEEMGGIDWSSQNIIAYNQNLDIYINQSVPQEKPLLFVSPQSLSLSTKVGQNPGSQTLEVKAIGGVGQLSVTASSNQPWLSVSPGSGNTPATLTVLANAQNLSAGLYQARVTIESAGAAEGSSPRVVLVYLSVKDPQVDVEVIKTAPHNIEASTTLTYKIFAINRGGDDAGSVTVIDSLPLSASYLSSSPSGSYNPASHTVTWNIGTLTKNSIGTLSLSVFIPGTVIEGTQLVNTVRITTASTETTYTNNSYNHRAGVVSQTGADIGVSKSARGQTPWVKRGFDLYYYIYYSNYGLRPSTNTTIIDTLPQGVIYISSDGGIYNATNRTVTWQIGTVSSYSCGHCKITVNIPADTANGAELINRVSIQTDTPEIDYRNNSFTQSVIVGAAIDPNDKSVYPQGDIQGTGMLFYTIHYENVGSVPTTFIKVEDILDSNLDEGSLIIGDGGTYDTSTRKITWIDNVSLAPGSENTRAVSFTIYPKQGLGHGTEIKNKATIYFDFEPGLSTNEVVSRIIRFAGNNSSVYVYPNPYKKGDAKFGGDYIWFKDVTSEATIKVYTIAGELVDEIKVTANPQGWKISDKKIASGVYIYTVTGGGGGKSVGKIGIVK
ncbi:MAG: DUF5050 domain-containing protein [bacterium]